MPPDLRPTRISRDPGRSQPANHGRIRLSRIR